MAEPASASSIEAHGVIGDQGTAALIADTGTIDFLCWPDLDSPTVFGALLDAERDSAWSIAPALDGAWRGQIYLPDTNVLLTRFAAPGGVGEITDFMPFPEPDGLPRLVRRARAIRGEVRFTLRCAPCLDDGRADTSAEASQDSVVFRGTDGPALRLRGSVPLTIEIGCHGSMATADFVLRAGGCADFLLGDAAEGLDQLDPDAMFQACTKDWHDWAGHSRYKGRWREMVMRSALALKLLTSRRHGSIAAAVTFGLPEAPGGVRNWDYRASWIRDASFTVYAFMRLGYVDEANHFMRWVRGRALACGADGAMQIMYGMDGRERLDETDLVHLRGYGGAAPVRIGNAAHTQIQLDIYGELLDAVYLANKYGEAISSDGWRNVVRIVDYVCDHWGEPDQGIWEMHGPARHWLHSRVMCWVAVDRAMRLAQKRSLPAPFARWHTARDAIHDSIWDEFWDEDLGSFVAARGATHMDGAMLLLPLVRFVSATDPRWLATLDAIGRELRRTR